MKRARRCTGGCGHVHGGRAFGVCIEVLPSGEACGCNEVVDAEARAEIRVGDALHLLRAMPAESVQCCVTSPPYWGLRDYGMEGQIGLESTPEEFVAKLVAVFAQVRRVLAKDGTLWLNIGDSYAGSWGAQGKSGQMMGRAVTHARAVAGSPKQALRVPPGLKQKDLVGVPWMLAFALRADGWYLRSEIIWAKSNPMPESIDDRPTKSHEQVFLLSKGSRYFYDAAAITEPTSGTAHSRGAGVHPKSLDAGSRGAKANASFSAAVRGIVERRNKRDVWTIGSQAYDGAHFATMPEALVDPCVLAGSARGGLVLDPFAGSGTVGVVALKHGRSFIGLELNPEYAEMARARIKGDAPLFNKVAAR